MPLVRVIKYDQACGLSLWRQAQAWEGEIDHQGAFIAWYELQPDCCAYCGVTYAEIKRLRIRRRGGYYAGWDIDRIDSKLGYEAGNLALACFVCNMAKGDMLTAEEARTIGKTVRQIWNNRLEALGSTRQE